VGSEHLVALVRLRRLTTSGAARSIRLGAGLSLAEVGAAVGDGVGAPTVWRWETGERAPHGDLALCYLAVLDALVTA
jgi:transcriptional regulator with XRE-family HTH domain